MLSWNWMNKSFCFALSPQMFGREFDNLGFPDCQMSHQWQTSIWAVLSFFSRKQHRCHCNIDLLIMTCLYIHQTESCSTKAWSVKCEHGMISQLNFRNMSRFGTEIQMRASRVQKEMFGAGFWKIQIQKDYNTLKSRGFEISPLQLQFVWQYSRTIVDTD